MPELPEVETARRIVERELVGHAAEKIALGLPKLMRDSPVSTLEPLLGRMLIAARRRAKVLAIEFDHGLTLLTHLKLAGQIAVHHDDGTRFAAGHPVPDPAGPFPHKSTHLIVRFSGARTLYWSDVRQFGWLRLVPTAEVDAVLHGFRFGPEAVGVDGIGVDDLERRLARRTIPIKTALLDQRVLAGLGNIYVDEALHAARLHPTRPANALTYAEFATLHAAIGWALERGIEQGGATIVHNKAYPRDGFPQVHARVGEPCPTCATTIVKTRVGARGTYWCPVCQPDGVGSG